MSVSKSSYNNCMDWITSTVSYLPQLKSFLLHKQSFFTHGTDALSEQGYPIYYIDPRIHVDDVCPLRQFDIYKTMRNTLLAAIILTQLLNPIAVPIIGRLVYKEISGLNELIILSFIGFVIAFLLLGLIVFSCSIYICNHYECHF